MVGKQISGNSGNAAGNNFRKEELADGEIRAALRDRPVKTGLGCFCEGRDHENCEPRQRLVDPAHRKDPGRYYRISLAIHSRLILMAMSADLRFSPIGFIEDDEDLDVSGIVRAEDKVLACVNMGMKDSFEIAGFLGIGIKNASAHLSVLWRKGAIQLSSTTRFSRAGRETNLFQPLGRMATKRLARKIVENANWRGRHDGV